MGVQNRATLVEGVTLPAMKNEKKLLLRVLFHLTEEDVEVS